MVNKKRRGRKKQVKPSKPIRSLLKSSEMADNTYNLRKIEKPQKNYYLRRFPTDEKPTYTEITNETGDLFGESKSPSNRNLMGNDITVGNCDQVTVWLHDTKNEFNRIPQTQNVTVDDSTSDNNFNMPSVSQTDKPKITRRKSISESQDNYHISEDVTQVEKRMRRHSFSGDVNVPIFKRIEDQCLDRLEAQHQQIFHASPPPHQTLSGWDRIREIERTIRKWEKTPRKLNIGIRPTNKSLKKSPQKSDVLGSLLAFDLRKFETSAKINEIRISPEKNDVDLPERNDVVDLPTKTIEKRKIPPMERSENLKIANEINSHKSIFYELETLVKNFKGCIDVNQELNDSNSLLDQSNVDRYFTEISRRLVKLNSFFNNLTKAEVDFLKINVETQTEINNVKVDVQVQTDVKNKIVKETQTVKNVLDKETQTFVLEKKDVSTHTNKLFWLLTKETQTDDVTVIVPKTKESFGATLDYLQFDTQEIINKHQNTIGKLSNTETDELSKNNEDLIISVESLKNSNQNSFKRARESEEDISLNKNKRPCNKFINYDLSIDFEGEDSPANKSKLMKDECLIEDYDKITTNDCEIAVESTPKNMINKENSLQSLNFDSKEKKQYSSRKQLFKESSSRKSDQFSESEFIRNYLSQCPIIKDNNNILKEIDQNCDTIKEEKIKILQNITLKPAHLEYGNNKGDPYMISSQEDMFNSDNDVDILEATPEKKISYSRSSLDITLPPPIEFQDNIDENQTIIDPDQTLVDVIEIDCTPTSRSPPKLLPSRKVTSTPCTLSHMTESILSLSPIRKQEMNPIEVIKHSKFTPLSVTSEKSQQSQKQSSILSFMTLNNKQKPCVAFTRLKNKNILLITSLANKNLITFQRCFSSKVTHLIVSVNEENFIEDHTIKYISAIAAGLWILNINWIQDCLNEKRIVSEEPYEVLDISGGEGPKLSRLNRLKYPLFKGFTFCVTPPFNSATREEVENIVKLLGAKTLNRPEDLLEPDGTIRVIVTEGVASQNYSLYETWLEALRIVTVDIEWISRSIGQYKILSLKSFLLCSDNFIDQLNYPQEMICDELSTCNTHSDLISN